MEQIFKSVIDSDGAPIVVCDLSHKIIYMNPKAEEIYNKNGKNLLGSSILDCHGARSAEIITEVADWFLKSEENNKVHTFYNEKQNKDVYMIALRDENKKLIGYYEKHEYRDRDMSSFYDMK